MTVDAPRNPWARYGIFMASIWLVFLTFPVVESLQAPVGPVWRGTTVALVLTFGVCYLVGMTRCWAVSDDQHNPRSVVWLGVLVALALTTVPVLRVEALGMLPYLTAFICYTFPFRRAATLSGLCLVLATVVPTLTGGLLHWVFMIGIVALVILTSLGTRWFTDRGDDYDRTMEKLRLAGERERVARDVHDVLGHSLTVVAVKAELAEKLLDVDVERARVELAEIRALTRTALAEIRETVGGLRVASLADEVDSARMALHGAGIDATLPDDLTVVDPRHRTVLAWTMREAVTNVVRHSGATACRITLGPDRLVVEDDGRGVRGRREGNGIRGLRERVTGVGGSVSLSTGQEGRGTRVEVTL